MFSEEKRKSSNQHLKAIIAKELLSLENVYRHDICGFYWTQRKTKKNISSIFSCPNGRDEKIQITVRSPITYFGA